MANPAPQPNARTSSPPDVLAPLLSAVVFGYYGFLFGLETHGSDGNPVALWITFLWVLRLAAVLYVGCLVLAARGRPGSELAYGLASAFATAGLAAVFVWDVTSPDGVAIHPILLLVLIVWNGYCAGTAIRDGLAQR
jgi:hypothetical protein